MGKVQKQFFLQDNIRSYLHNLGKWKSEIINVLIVNQNIVKLYSINIKRSYYWRHHWESEKTHPWVGNYIFST